MNETTCLQLENLIRASAPTPPPGREEAVNDLIAWAKKDGALITLAVITLMSQRVSVRKSFKMLAKAGVSEEEIHEALDFLDTRLKNSVLLIKCTIEEVVQHGPN
jgi:hypothetical protein